MILDEIVKKRKINIAKQKQIKSLAMLKQEAEALPQNRDFPLEKVGKTGIWGVVVLDIAIGTSYKYLIETENGVL